MPTWGAGPDNFLLDMRVQRLEADSTCVEQEYATCHAYRLLVFTCNNLRPI